jgi:hypothetical protein
MICESAPKRDPGQNSSKSLKSSAKTPDVGGPIGADRDPARNKISQCINELRLIQVASRFGADSHHDELDHDATRAADAVTGRNRELRTEKQGRNPKGEISVLQKQQGRGHGEGNTRE